MGALPCLCFLLCLDGGAKTAMSRSLEFNDVCGKVCVHVCVCAIQEEVCPWCKPFEVLRIWVGYLGWLWQDTHREKEGAKEKVVLAYR